VGVKVGIADKKWGSNAACGPRTRKSGWSTDPVAPRRLHCAMSLSRVAGLCRSMKREVSVEISSEGFIRTGFKSDVCQVRLSHSSTGKSFSTELTVVKCSALLVIGRPVN